MSSLNCVSAAYAIVEPGFLGVLGCRLAEPGLEGARIVGEFFRLLQLDLVEVLFVLEVYIVGAPVLEDEELGELAHLVLEVDEYRHQLLVVFEGTDDESQVIFVHVVGTDVALDAAEDALGLGDHAAGDRHDGGVDVVFVGPATHLEEGKEALEELAGGGDGADGAAPEDLVVEVELGDDVEQLVEGHLHRAVLVAAEHRLELLGLLHVVEVQLDHVVVRLARLRVLRHHDLDADLELLAERHPRRDRLERLEAVCEVLREQVHHQLLEVLSLAQLSGSQAPTSRISLPGSPAGTAPARCRN